MPGTAVTATTPPAGAPVMTAAPIYYNYAAPTRRVRFYGINNPVPGPNPYADGRVRRIQRYYETCVEQLRAAAPLVPPGTTAPRLPDAHQRFVSTAIFLLAEHDRAVPGPGPALDPLPMEAAYQHLKASVLAATAAGHVPLADMEASLERYSAMRRALQQAVKAHVRQQALHLA